MIPLFCSFLLLSFPYYPLLSFLGGWLFFWTPPQQSFYSINYHSKKSILFSATGTWAVGVNSVPATPAVQAGWGGRRSISVGCLFVLYLTKGKGFLPRKFFGLGILNVNLQQWPKFTSGTILADNHLGSEKIPFQLPLTDLSFFCCHLTLQIWFNLMRLLRQFRNLSI